ncbi:capsid protein [Alces alces faeces associated smacovirus MP78]|uniref:Capsid protein n=1 Tax=Alces alces faeces associated smacovirus MP78 TaxID=2219142 RepID=A0A2Z5CL51_9VIRU|nr:capsid protein [Alces alces faeces associated smacovirus MP78]AXB22595.1 capsid protein [Alces alces faeces associated smacovirus MP78]
MTTNKAFASYHEIIDLHTESDKVGVIGIHTPTDYTPHRMFGGYFKQFKKFKYLGCSISLVPAARLPADPSQVSYGAGEPPIDPRDLLNPIMFHGCHGNDLGNVLNRLYTLNSDGVSGGFATNIQESDSVLKFEEITNSYYDDNLLENLYYKALTDNTWRKAHPQRGFRKGGLRPLIYSMATNVQIMNPNEFSTERLAGSNGHLSITSPINTGMPEDFAFSVSGSSGRFSRGVIDDGVKVFTPHLTGLGWLDTRSVITQGVESDWTTLSDTDAIASAQDSIVNKEVVTTLPKIFMGVILLPPAYKTEQYYRMIINHRFGFKDFRGISFANDQLVTPAYANFNDSDYEYNPPEDPDSGEGDSPSLSGSEYLVSDLQQYFTSYVGMGTWKLDTQYPQTVYETLTEYDSGESTLSVSFPVQNQSDGNSTGWGYNGNWSCSAFWYLDNGFVYLGIMLCEESLYGFYLWQNSEWTFQNWSDSLDLIGSGSITQLQADVAFAGLVNSNSSTVDDLNQYQIKSLSGNIGDVDNA